MNTISWNEARHFTWDAIVIGAGCAGAIVARQLAKGGRRALLVDRAQFPRYKVCGCCLGTAAQETLASIGLGNLLTTSGAVKTNAMIAASAGRRVRIPLPDYAVLSRERLDLELVQSAIDEGVSFLPGTTAKREQSPVEHQVVSLRCADESVKATGKIIIAADGLGGGLMEERHQARLRMTRSRVGAGAVSIAAPLAYEPGVVYMACGRAGYVGVCRLEDGRTTIAAAMDVAFVKDSQGLANAARRLLNDAGFSTIPDINDIVWKGTPLLTQRPAAVAGHRTFLVGDSAGYVEPFTGEGMKWALTSAVALAPIASAASENYSREHEHAWRMAHRNVVSSRTRTCIALSAALRRPWIVSAAIRVISIRPGVAGPFVRKINAPVSIQKGIHP
ncbi:MAG: FAD-dependent monooxygenase [Candidatus Hydrogenedentes bacterium]|nr:FAD-dependent monooxygenase [Candidatus Hydrogenedentota bacterium]